MARDRNVAVSIPQWTDYFAHGFGGSIVFVHVQLASFLNGRKAVTQQSSYQSFVESFTKTKAAEAAKAKKAEAAAAKQAKLDAEAAALREAQEAQV